MRWRHGALYLGQEATLGGEQTKQPKSAENETNHFQQLSWKSITEILPRIFV